MTRTLSSILITVSITLLIINGCSNPLLITPNQQLPELLEKKPHIRGSITDIHTKATTDSMKAVSGILVEGAKEPDTVYDRAFIEITKDTRIFMGRGQSYVLVSSNDLYVGQRVEVLFVGPIQTSDPVQAKAVEIIIIQ